MNELDPESGLDPEPSVLQRISSVQFTAYSGPQPPPEILAQYEQACPGTARLILEEFRGEATHRRNNEERIVRSYTLKQNVGAISSSLVGIIGISGGLWLAHEGRSLGGLSSVFGTLATLLAVYLYQDHRSHDPDEKD